MKKADLTVTISPVLTVAALGTQRGVEVSLVSKGHNRQKKSAEKGKDPYPNENEQESGNWSTLEYAVLPLFQKCWVRNGQALSFSHQCLSLQSYVTHVSPKRTYRK